MKWIKKAWTWLKWTLLVISGLLAGIAIDKIRKDLAIIGSPEKKRNWTSLNDTSIALIDNNGEIEHVIKLPKDPGNKKQLKIKDIDAVGIAEGGNVCVKINHNITNRRFPSNSR